MTTATTQGDLKILALAVQALIQSHPDKEAFRQTFLELLDNTGPISLYAGTKIQDYNGKLLQDLLRTASKGPTILE